MEWAKPLHSKGALDRAGKVLVSDDDLEDLGKRLELDNATRIMNNGRASHNYPLNTFKVTLRSKAAEIDPDRVVAQRIKRMSSIESKLHRFPGMRMSQMQDIGGCRAILATTKNVRELVTRYEKSDLKHKLERIDDYISSPKPSGYRSVHLIYKYNSDKQAPSVYNGLSIELQFRSRLQHVWATAVETVGTFLNQAFKSSQGEDRWLRFFALMGTVFAKREGAAQTIVPNTPQKKQELVAEVRQLASDLNVLNALEMYATTVDIGLEGAVRGDHYFLLKLEPRAGKMTVTGFKKRDIDRASEQYLLAEKQIAQTPGSEAVLVSVDSLAVLERAYPNYFLDTKVFLDELRRAIK